MRTLRRFFFSPSAPAAAAEVFVAFLALSVVFAGALEAAVEAGALEAVETGLGAMDDKGDGDVRMKGRRRRGWCSEALDRIRAFVFIVCDACGVICP